MTIGEIQFRVRYSECDPMGVVHHATYPIWLEMGRTELLRATGTTYREMESAGHFLVVAKLELRYRRPARYDDVLTLRTHVLEVGMVKILHQYQLRRGAEIIAVATSTLGCVDRQGQACPMPSTLRDAIAKTEGMPPVA